MLEHRRSPNPKTERAERAGFRHAAKNYQRKLRENSALYLQQMRAYTLLSSQRSFKCPSHSMS